MLKRSFNLQDLGTPSEKIWPGYNELPAVKKMTFTEYPYNNLRKRFGALLSDQGFDLMNKWVPNSRGSLGICGQEDNFLCCERFIKSRPGCAVTGELGVVIECLKSLLK